ncbi:helix-turn-helix domain-containing protein [Sinomicrobium sp. M5D2P9]
MKTNPDSQEGYGADIIDILIDILQQIKATGVSHYTPQVYLTSAEVMEKYRISESTLYRLRKNKKIPFIKLNKKYLYPQRKLDVFLDNN